MNMNHYIRLSIIALTCIPATMDIIAQQPAPTGDFMMPQLSDAELKALEEFAQFFESLPEEDQKKIMEEAVVIAQQIDEEIKKMTPEERAKFEAELEKEFQSLFGGEGAQTQPEVTKPIASPESKKQTTEPTKVERDKLKESLNSIVKYIDTITSKSDRLKRVSDNRSIDARWQGQRESLMTLKEYCAVIVKEDRLLNVMLSDENSVLRTHVEKLIKAFTNADKELVVPAALGLDDDKDQKTDIKDVKPEDIKRNIQEAHKQFKNIVSALEQTTEIDQVTWGIKNILRTHAPEELKKIDVSSSSTTNEMQQSTQDKQLQAGIQPSSITTPIQQEEKRITRTLEQAVNQLASTLEINAIASTIKAYTRDIMSPRGAQEGLSKARTLQRVFDSTHLADIINDIAIGLKTTQDKTMRSHASKKLNSPAVIELREALNESTTSAIEKRIKELPEKQSAARTALEEMHTLLITMKKQLD